MCVQKIKSDHFPNFPQRYPLTKMLFFTNFGHFGRFCEGTTEHTIRALWSGCERIQLLNTFSTSICFIPGVKSDLSVSKSNVLRRKTQCFVFCLKINYSPSQQTVFQLFLADFLRETRFCTPICTRRN